MMRLALLLLALAHGVSCGTDFHALIGADPKSDRRALSRAFRRTARKWHPDRFSPSDPNKELAERVTTALNKAFEVLTDPEQKKIYALGGFDDVVLLSDEDAVAAGLAVDRMNPDKLVSEHSVELTPHNFEGYVVGAAHPGVGYDWPDLGAAAAAGTPPPRSVWIVQLYRDDSERCMRFASPWDKIAASRAAPEDGAEPAFRFGRVHVRESRPLIESWFDTRVPRGQLPRVVALHPNGTASVHSGALTRSAVSAFIDAQIPSRAVREVRNARDHRSWSANATDARPDTVRVTVFSERIRAPDGIRAAALRLSRTAVFSHVNYNAGKAARALARRQGVKDPKRDLPFVSVSREKGLLRSTGRRVELRGGGGIEAWLSQMGRSLPNVIEIDAETAGPACVSRKCAVIVAPARSGAAAQALRGAAEPSPTSSPSSASPSPTRAHATAYGLAGRALAEAVANHNAAIVRRLQGKGRRRRDDHEYSVDVDDRKAGADALVHGAVVDAGAQPKFAAHISGAGGSGAGGVTVAFLDFARGGGGGGGGGGGDGDGDGDGSGREPAFTTLRIDPSDTLSDARSKLETWLAAAASGSVGSNAWTTGRWPRIEGPPEPATWNLDGDTPGPGGSGSDPNEEALEMEEVVPLIIILIIVIAFSANPILKRFRRYEDNPADWVPEHLRQRTSTAESKKAK